MSGIIAVYALVVAVLIAGNMKPPPDMQYSLFNGFMHLACGLSVGLTGLAAGYAIGIVGDSVCEPVLGGSLGSGICLISNFPQGVRAYMQQSRIFVGMVLILIFGEVLGLYGYALILEGQAMVHY